MRIFYICRRVPFPPDRDDKIATFNQIRHLAEQHDVHVFCLGEGTLDLDNISGLQQYVRSVTASPVSGSTIKLRALKALVGGDPLSVAALNAPELRRDPAQIRRAGTRPDNRLQLQHGAIRRALSAGAADHAIRRSRLAEMAAIRWTVEDTPQMGLCARRKTSTRYEKHIAHSFAHALVHTAAEKRDFQRLISGVPVGLVGNGVDLGYFRSAGAVKQSGSIVFTGVMDYRPNVDAVVWFCQQILPVVRAAPKAHFTICGRRPVRAVRRLARLVGVTVTGSVPDTRPYLDRAEVFVAPLRIARGVQNKLLEVLSMGLPCVTSTAARNGTAVPDGEGIVATDDPQQFATHVIDLLQDANWRAVMGRRARAVTEASYHWEAQMARLDQVIATAVSRPLPSSTLSSRKSSR